MKALLPLLLLLVPATQLRSPLTEMSPEINIVVDDCGPRIDGSKPDMAMMAAPNRMHGGMGEVDVGGLVGSVIMLRSKPIVKQLPDGRFVVSYVLTPTGISSMSASIRFDSDEGFSNDVGDYNLDD